MARKKKAETVLADPPPPPVPFRRRRPIYREDTFGDRSEETEYEPLWVRYQINLTYAEIEAIPFGREVTAQQAWQSLAPYIVAWNIAAPNPETGAIEAVPPPAVAGWEVMRHLDAFETSWLLRRVKFAYLQSVASDEGKADSTPSGSGPEQNGEPT